MFHLNRNKVNGFGGVYFTRTQLVGVKYAKVGTAGKVFIWTVFDSTFSGTDESKNMLNYYKSADASL